MTHNALPIQPAEVVTHLTKDTNLQPAQVENLFPQNPLKKKHLNGN